MCVKFCFRGVVHCRNFNAGGENVSSRATFFNLASFRTVGELVPFTDLDTVSSSRNSVEWNFNRTMNAPSDSVTEGDLRFLFRKYVSNSASSGRVTSVDRSLPLLEGLRNIVRLRQGRNNGDSFPVCVFSVCVFRVCVLRQVAAEEGEGGVRVTLGATRRRRLAYSVVGQRARRDTVAELRSRRVADGTNKIRRSLLLRRRQLKFSHKTANVRRCPITVIVPFEGRVFWDRGLGCALLDKLRVHGDCPVVQQVTGPPGRGDCCRGSAEIVLRREICPPKFPVTLKYCRWETSQYLDPRTSLRSSRVP